MTSDQVATLLTACAEAFDIAQAIRTTPIRLGSNISDFARPIAIGGGQELIAEGHHREAVFWICFIHTLCQTVLQNDALHDMQARLTPDYERLLAAIGIVNYEDLAERHEQSPGAPPHRHNPSPGALSAPPLPLPPFSGTSLSRVILPDVGSDEEVAESGWWHTDPATGA